MSRSVKLSWRQWAPGLDNDHLTLGEVLDTLPAANPSDIPWLIRLLENPASPFALPGAITLARHDAIHVLLGRGLRPQDEAFVIGFTMGASSHCRTWQKRLFKFVARTFYPGPYKFSKDDLLAYDLAFGLADSSAAADLEYFPFERFMDLTIADLRKRLGIDRLKLYATYRHEQIILPGSVSSLRLDTDLMGRDPASLAPPSGVDSNWTKEK